MWRVQAQDSGKSSRLGTAQPRAECRRFAAGPLTDRHALFPEYRLCRLVKLGTGVPCWVHINRRKLQALKALFLPDTKSYMVLQTLIH